MGIGGGKVEIRVREERENGEDCSWGFMVKGDVIISSFRVEIGVLVFEDDEVIDMVD